MDASKIHGCLVANPVLLKLDQKRSSSRSPKVNNCTQEKGRGRKTHQRTEKLNLKCICHDHAEKVKVGEANIGNDDVPRDLCVRVSRACRASRHSMISIMSFTVPSRRSTPHGELRGQSDSENRIRTYSEIESKWTRSRVVRWLEHFVQIRGQRRDLGSNHAMVIFLFQVVCRSHLIVLAEHQTATHNFKKIPFTYEKRCKPHTSAINLGS